MEKPLECQVPGCKFKTPQKATLEEEFRYLDYHREDTHQKVVWPKPTELEVHTPNTFVPRESGNRKCKKNLITTHSHSNEDYDQELYPRETKRRRQNKQSPDYNSDSTHPSNRGRFFAYMRNFKVCRGLEAVYLRLFNLYSFLYGIKVF